MQTGEYWLNEGTAFVYCSYPARLLHQYYVEHFFVSKNSPVHAMKACRGRRGIALLILNVGARWR